MAGTFTVSGYSAGLATGSMTIGPLTITGSALVGEILTENLTTGDNTFTVPPLAVAVWIVPPATNTQTLKVRTSLNVIEAGLPISTSDPFGPYSFRGLAPTSVIINASGSVAGLSVAFI